MASGNELKTLLATMQAIDKKLSEPNYGNTTPQAVTGVTEKGFSATAPNIRRGESHLTSRPFSFTRFIGMCAGAVEKEACPVEYELMRAFRNTLDQTRWLPQDAGTKANYYPLHHSFLPPETANDKATLQLLRASAMSRDVDYDELDYIARTTGDRGMAQRVQQAQGVLRASTLDYLQGGIGGELVAPPEMGEIIPLMRNRSALDQAGARYMPIPPQGSWVAPRVTGATTGYWLQSGQSFTPSNPTTGEAVLSAKKLGVFVTINNELFKYASAAVDALLKVDIGKTLALGFDSAGLYGASGAGIPRGLVNYTGTNEVYFYADSTPAPSGLGTNGNTLNPQDGFLMAGEIEDRNFDLTEGFSWIMRPKMKAAILSRRADSVTTGDGAGQFVQSQFRTTADGLTANWDGYKISASSQIPKNLTQGSGTGLTDVWFGVWPEFLMGVYGAVEFVANPWSGPEFQKDQTVIRGVLHCDCVPRYPGAFGVYRNLIIQ